MEEKIKLSTLLKEYEEKLSKKDEKYGFYFEEQKIESKITRLRQFYEVFGDISLNDRYFKAIMYYGQPTKEVENVKWIGETLLKYDNIPEKFISNILLSYTASIFSKYPVKEYFDSLVEEYGMSEKTFELFSNYLELKKFEIKVIDSKYGIEIIELSKEYSPKFLDRIYYILEKEQIELSKVLELLPSREFIEKSNVHLPIGYDILSGEDIVIRIIKGYIDLNQFKDEDKIILGPCGDGSNVYTTFTKKEYLEELKKQQTLLKK